MKIGTNGRWLSVVSHLDPRYGGLSAIVPQLCSAVARTGKYSMDLAAFCSPSELYSQTKYADISISVWPTSRLQWWRDKQLNARFQALVERSDGLHIHGLWEQSTAIAARTAREMKKPYIISAHGMLESWAIKNKKLKKQIYSSLVERTNMQHASCLHALTQSESHDYLTYGVKSPIAVIPNAVHIPQSIDAHAFLDRYPNLKNKCVLLFMGRLHVKKGLDILVKAWAAMAKQYPDTHLVLAGPDFEGTRESIEKLVCDYSLQDQVMFTGMLRDELKWSALACAKCFVLPSYSEGLSVSVLEAMGVGIPVIVTEQCNLPEVQEFNTGWVIRAEVDALIAAIEAFLENSVVENTAIGANGKQLVEDRYNWAAVTAQITSLYQAVEGKNSLSGPVAEWEVAHG